MLTIWLLLVLIEGGDAAIYWMLRFIYLLSAIVSLRDGLTMILFTNLPYSWESGLALTPPLDPIRFCVNTGVPAFNKGYLFPVFGLNEGPGDF